MDATTADSNFDTRHPIYTTITGVAKLRNDQVALRRGDQIVRNYSEKPGLFAVSRIDAASGDELLIVFNTSKDALNANVEIERSVQKLEMLRGNCPTAPRLAGSVAVSLPAFGYMACKIK